MPRIRWWIFAISSLSLAPRDAAAICREVTETGSSPPVIKTDQEILVIKRSGVPVGCEPPTPGGDAGAGGDGGPAPGDAGAPKPDAGDTPGDAGAADGGALDAGSCQPRLADTVTWVVQ